MHMDFSGAQTEVSKDGHSLYNVYTFVHQLGCPQKYIQYAAIYTRTLTSVVNKIEFPRVDIH